MKTNILSKIALTCLLLISVSCSKENIENPEEAVEAKSGYTIIDGTQSNKISVTTKYLKVVYEVTADKEFVRNAFINLTSNTSTVTENFAKDDLFTFSSTDQSLVDNIFDETNSFCILCNHINFTEYVTVVEATFPLNTPEDVKEDIRDSKYGEDLVLVIINGNTETWVMRSCCIPPQDDEEFPINTYGNYLPTTNVLQY